MRCSPSLYPSLCFSSLDVCLWLFDVGLVSVLYVRVKSLCLFMMGCFLFLPLLWDFTLNSALWVVVSTGLKLRLSSSTDPEPGRCKRTDGKKWRCSRDVAPDYKYCERHLHRGCPHSRKPVEVHANNDNIKRSHREDYQSLPTLPVSNPTINS